MSWEGAPHYRWVKMFNGQRHRITCDDLRRPRTKEESYHAANAWWDQREAELRLSHLSSEQRAAMHELDQREAWSSRHDLDELDHVRKDKDFILMGESEPDFRERMFAAEDLAEAGVKVTPEVFKAIPVPKTAVWRDRLRNPEPPQLDTRLSAVLDTFKMFIRSQGQRPKTHLEWLVFLKAFEQAELNGKRIIHPDMSVSGINEDTIESIHLWIRSRYASKATQRKYGGFVKRFLTYAWSKRLIELPRNLDQFKVRVGAKKITTIEPKQIREVLKALPERKRLYALLGLNCGMLPVDIGSLKQSEVDWTNGRITRKRTKTEERDDTPEVNYKLWPETFALLKALRAHHPVYALTSKRNTPLVDHRYDETGKPILKDLVSLQWKLAKTKIPFKMFRSASATMLESHEEYGRHGSYFLGHAPATMKHRHYAKPSDELFDTILEWLRHKLLKA